MSRHLLKITTTALGATAATGALVLAGTGMANATTYQAGQSHSNRSAVDGSGDADATARATDAGHLTVSTEARGANGATGPLGGSTTQATTGSATSVLDKRVAAADGTYRVVVKYKKLSGVERDSGSNGRASTVRHSEVTFVNQTGGGNSVITRTQNVPTTVTNTSTVMLIKVPDNASGYLQILGGLAATSTANGASNHAEASAKVSAVTFTVTRVSGS